ncbi:hypothetical protein BD410DRAFT_689147, partial [Rickenella mellea]
QLPVGSTLVPVIVGSDKTHLTNCSGAQACHVAVMSCANISKSIRTKASAHAFEPVAYIPLGDWIDEGASGLLQSRCYHFCMDIVLSGIKKAARHGCQMVDPKGFIRKTYTPFASH